MEYIDLKKLYYNLSDQDYIFEYSKRFNSEDTHRLDFFIGNRQAFFTETTDILRKIITIIKLDNEITRLSDRLPQQAKIQYSKKCMIDEIVITNKIEGVHSSRQEIGDVLETLYKQSTEKKKNSRYFGLVIKYLKLMSNEEVSLNTCKDIRNIYDEICLNEILLDDIDNKPDGKIFRKKAESVYNETGKEIHKGVYPEERIIEYIEKALEFLNDESIMPIYRITIFHYMIEYIHPFYDGNGRLGRFILSYCLSKEFNSLLAYHISQTIKKNIREYYKAFELCNNPHNLGDLTPFLIMQLNMIFEAMQDLKEALYEKSIDFDKYKDVIRKYCNIDFSINSNLSNLYYILLQASLFSENGLTNKEIKSALNIKSDNTVKILLNKIPYEALITINKGRTKYYELNLAFFDDIMIDSALKKEGLYKR